MLMPRPRFRLVDLMGFVVVLAVDLALGRILHSLDPALLIGLIPSGLTLQAALIHLARGRVRRRWWAFGVGWLGGGSLATGSFVYAMLTPDLLGIDGLTGRLSNTPGSWLAHVWAAYTRGIFRTVFAVVLPRSLFTPDSVARTVRDEGLRALAWSGPQLVAGLIGGLITAQVARRWYDGKSSAAEASLRSDDRSRGEPP